MYFRICVTVKMERSDVAENNSSSGSEDDQVVLQLADNSKNLVVSDQESERIDENWNRSISSGEKKSLIVSVQSIENKGLNESGKGLSSSNKIRPAVRSYSEVLDKTFSISKTISVSANNSTCDEDEVFSDDNSKNEAAAEDIQQSKKTKRRRNSIIFSSKGKSVNSQVTEDKDDSGLVLDASNEVDLDMTTDDETITISKANSNSQNRSALKRKLYSPGPSDEQFDELEKDKPVKRGRGKYKLRDLSGNVNKNKPDVKHGPYKSKKDNTSKVIDEDEPENSEAEVEINRKGKTKGAKTQNADKTLAEIQKSHNDKILQIINRASPSELRGLNRIGLKTAMMIHQYIKFNGRLASIRDLQDMSGWSPRFFELFISANNITLD